MGRHAAPDPAERPPEPEDHTAPEADDATPAPDGWATALAGAVAAGAACAGVLTWAGTQPRTTALIAGGSAVLVVVASRIARTPPGRD
jgi:hypothetical protein